MKIKKREKGNHKTIAKAIVVGIIILSFYHAIFEHNFFPISCLGGSVIIGNIMSIINMRKKIKAICEQEEYRQLEQYYNQVIDNFIKLCNELNIKDPIEIFCLYTTMYKKGLLSYNKDFKYNNEHYELFNLLGINVINGKGVCRHIASMLTDIYRMMNYNSDNLKIYVKSTRNYSKLINGSLKIFGNHMVTIVDDSKYKYILCPTNRRIFISNKGKLTSIFDKEKKAKVCLAAFLPAYFYEDKNNLIDVIKRLKMSSLTNDEILERYRTGIDLSELYETKLEEFYDNNRILYERIYELNNIFKNERKDIKLRRLNI